MTLLLPGAHFLGHGESVGPALNVRCQVEVPLGLTSGRQLPQFGSSLLTSLHEF